MKKIIFLSCTLMMCFMLINNSCKKGENDPFFSFRTRDARITGKWEMISSEYYYIHTYSIGQTKSTSSSFDNGKMTSTTYNSTSGTPITETTTYPYSSNLTIEKDGNYLWIFQSDTSNYEYSGAWHWLNDNKKKTLIAFDGRTYPYIVNRLTNKELILKIDFVDIRKSNGEVTYQNSITVEYNFEKK
ncbi:MAG: hypothetical protein K9J13_12065 [Saprospiraceae bacterium]|nr:hypothetical protein [Saprospiraceae bacterium]